MLKEYNKLISKDNNKKKSKSRNKVTIMITSFITRLLITSIIILLYVVLLRQPFYKTSKIKKIVSNEFNFLKMVNSLDRTLFNNQLLSKILRSTDSIVATKVATNLYFDCIDYIDGVNYITNKDNDSCTSIDIGVVTSIRCINNLYEVSILSSNDITYTYGNLSQINIKIYEYVDACKIIGKSSVISDAFQYSLIIEKDDVRFSYYDYAN